MCVGVDLDGIEFKFYTNPPQYMWIDVNPTTSKQDPKVEREGGKLD